MVTKGWDAETRRAFRRYWLISEQSRLSWLGPPWPIFIDNCLTVIQAVLSWNLRKLETVEKQLLIIIETATKIVARFYLNEIVNLHDEMLPPIFSWFPAGDETVLWLSVGAWCCKPPGVCYVMTDSDKSITIINVNTVTVVGPDHSRIKMQTIPISDILYLNPCHVWINPILSFILRPIITDEP